MTAATAPLPERCRHTWKQHTCWEPPDHDDRGPCRCRCGATTTREAER